ncbi:MAG: AAA family ATPase [Cyanobacteria bacterium REEB494]|uniref:AAA family ATPase n=1 Tax=Cylindrospermopsis raciborskii TaxID=77022 RepID=UPI00070CDA54|nr:AAA family ATPase [Cylindrospermopsis raciborskii]KRH95980.1 hypothetical protein ASL19_08660 [Cylindrospermopsis sp. CR12]MBU6344735.1 AAA family ATPase [Cyanobacteria bacterium REEB494]TPX28617.1 hypothetical protein FIV49_10730 [Cylindrospermopsis raciborskii GIHE 2018]
MSQEVNLKNLPLGINTLDKLRGSDCVYVDKTHLALKLIKQPGAFFLSRPRRFGKSLFKDITISEAYSSICGYTETDLRESFGDHLEGVDWDALRHWYNGYNWTGSETVYNPRGIKSGIMQHLTKSSSETMLKNTVGNRENLSMKLV